MKLVQLRTMHQVVESLYEVRKGFIQVISTGFTHRPAISALCVRVHHTSRVLLDASLSAIIPLEPQAERRSRGHTNSLILPLQMQTVFNRIQIQVTSLPMEMTTAIVMFQPLSRGVSGN